MPLVKYFLHIELWIAGEPGLMTLVKYFLHMELWNVGESEACYLRKDLYSSSHETREGRSYRTPDALWIPYRLLLFFVVLLLGLLLLLFFVLCVLVSNTGISVRAVFLRPSIVIVSLHISCSFHWFGPETIEHHQVDSIIEIVVSGTRDANQVRHRPYALDVNYDKVGLVLTENFVRESKQPIGRQTNTLVFKLELPQKNNSSHPLAILLLWNPQKLCRS